MHQLGGRLRQTTDLRTQDGLGSGTRDRGRRYDILLLDGETGDSRKAVRMPTLLRDVDMAPNASRP
ncbi:MAG TPA: hypothetical protein VMM56_10665 [Planctomycetaceae bacterium]|nr:hypothetical protein [Planctomycetaceae bacterium]